MSARRNREWLELHWPRPLPQDLATGLLRSWAADQRSPVLAVETRAGRNGVRYLLGVPGGWSRSTGEGLSKAIAGTAIVPVQPQDRRPVFLAGRLRASTRHRPLRTTDVEQVSRAVLAALAHVRDHEELVLQVLLGPRRVPLAVPTNSPSSLVQPWHSAVLHGQGSRLDGEKRSQLRAKVSDHGFACTIRLGVRARNRNRQHFLLLNLMAALRTAEASGALLRLRREHPDRLDTGSVPWLWPLRLNVGELVGLFGWPFGDGELPGLGPVHPRLVRADTSVRARGRVVAASAAPGDDRLLGLSAKDALQHLHVLGPTGVGKSTLLTNLITADVAAERGVVVVDPKGDLVTDVLARVPAARRDDIVVLDPSDTMAPVGLNPLARTNGIGADLSADGVLAVFRGLYADAWGPRTQDILHASLLTLTKRGDASLVMLPLLLTNPGFRRSITARFHTEDPVALGPFWAWYEALSDGERQQAIAPVMNKLRPFLLRPQVRAVLGQVRPRFDIRQVFTQRKVLLVSLAKGLIGSEAAGLLGSLVVARLWQTTLSRTAIPAEKRHPVLVYIDEVQDYLHLPTDVADVLAQARGYGVGMTLAHQHLSQLQPTTKSAVLANARSRVCFTLAPEDANTIARGATGSGLTAEDFTALGLYEIYASLLADGQSTGYASGRTLAPGPEISDPAELRELSRTRYGQPLSEVEAGFATLTEHPSTASGTSSAMGRRSRRSS